MNAVASMILRLASASSGYDDDEGERKTRRKKVRNRKTRDKSERETRRRRRKTRGWPTCKTRVLASRILRLASGSSLTTKTLKVKER